MEASAPRALRALLLLSLAGGWMTCTPSYEETLRRELEGLRRQIARLEEDNARLRRSTPPPGDTLPAVAAGPDLPVVRAPRMEDDPFGRGTEPAIRIGAKGPLAPGATRAKTVAKAAPTAKVPDFTRMDEQGNLVDVEGNIVYRAGTGSPSIDTVDEAEPGVERRYEDDPHEAPATMVERAAGVPRLAGAEPAKAAPGIHPVVKQRLKELTLSEDGLPDPVDREMPIRVEAAEPPAPTEAVSAPPRPAAPVAATGSVAEDDASLAPSAAVIPALKAPRPAPGPRRAIEQVAFAPSKDRAARKQYDLAVAKVQARAFAEAESRLEAFLERHYAHELADNALYWLAETAYAQGEWLQALAWFQDVIIRYPAGNKLGDAMLKTALCYAALGDTSYAARILSDVESLYPSSPIARTARERREALGTEL